MNSKFLTALIIAIVVWWCIPHSVKVAAKRALTAPVSSAPSDRSGAAQAKAAAPLHTRQFQVTAGGVSADGSVIVGTFLPLTGNMHAYRWTESGGAQDLGTIGEIGAEPTGVSANGSVIVGRFTGAKFVPHAFRWTQSGGAQDLGANFGQGAVAMAR